MKARLVGPSACSLMAKSLWHIQGINRFVRGDEDRNEAKFVLKEELLILFTCMNWISLKPAIAGLAEMILPFIEPFYKIQLIQVKLGTDDKLRSHAAHRPHACYKEVKKTVQKVKQEASPRNSDIHSCVYTTLLWSAPKTSMSPNRAQKLARTDKYPQPPYSTAAS